jgi:hypothetical protein
MSSPSSKREDCTRSGVVLTCHLDGRKVFRAVRSDSREVSSPEIVESPTIERKSSTKGEIPTSAHVRRRK